MNAVEIEEAVSELVQRYADEGFDADNFPFDFLAAFGNPAATLKRLRSTGKSSTNQSDVGGVLQSRNIHLKVARRTGIPACQSVSDTLRELVNSPETAKRNAKFALATDGVTLEAENLTPGGAGETLACDFADLPDRFTFFLELAGIRTVKAIRENAFDVKATGRLNKLYVELLRHNPDWGTAERREDMNHFMARLIFCFFAEDTGIFHGGTALDEAGLGLFTQAVQQMSQPDAANTHEVLGECFRAMDTPANEKDRKAANIRPYANTFPYVNGGLFGGAGESTDVPTFSKLARAYLLHIGGLDWTKINPDIFGSMIQAVADDEERGALGMHYTSVPNILKVINPLFLDELREKLEAAGDRPQALRHLRKRLARIRVFDPACGSGNFLVIAYKQMRAIEIEINKRLGEPERSSDIPLTNFRGIELRHFAAEIARLALVIAEYQCDVLHRGQKLALAEFLPLDAQNWITCGNALRIDWLTVCPPTGTDAKMHADDLFETPLDQAEIDFENEGGETYICGNPPYLGFTWQSNVQKHELRDIFGERTKKWKSLDYVSAWFMKAVDYGSATKTSTALVATNSICQGEQVPILWPILFATGHEISFAHTSFHWANLASHNAGVTVVVVGIDKQPEPKRIIYAVADDGHTTSKSVETINAYLAPGSNVIVKPLSKVLGEKANMVWGNKPTDGGNLVLSTTERDDLVRKAPDANSFIRPYLGSKEFIRGLQRHCIWIDNDEAEDAANLPQFRDRIEGVRKFRAASRAAETRAAAAYPHRFRQIQAVAETHSLILPQVSSERREYLQIGLLPAPAVVSNLAFALYDASLWNIALIASRLHLVWVATVCGKLETRYRYSNTLGWNTFPVPPLTEQNKADLTRCAEDILLAREAYWPATIADMYDPKRMDDEFPEVRAAHERNDETLERIYLGRRFKNDTERLEHLFDLYTKMTADEEGKAK